MSRIATIDIEKCRPDKCNKECMKKCPPQRMGKSVIDIEDLGKAKIYEPNCIGCGQCVTACPFNAIKIINLPKQIPKEIIHRYGENGFQLYKFPEINKNCVMTFIGQNGIGKSTILNILSGNLYPNFSVLTDKQDLTHMLKGNTMITYFQKLLRNELIFSIKEQKIKQFRENNQTIQEYIELNNFYIDSWFNELELQDKLETNINVLSGGELQRFYCWCTFSKPANVYIFDEPTNFLDVKQRLIVGRMIKSLCTEDNYVITVEHDMSIADYMSDKVIVMFGVPSSYGVISNSMTVSKGINEYLDGYISSLNIRFRDYEFNLSPLSTIKDDNDILLTKINDLSYEGTIITYPNITINIPDGIISLNGSINVVLGENGTGKTTFLNYIAQNTGLIVSYKTQHLHRLTNDMTVLEYLYCDNYQSSLFKSTVRVTMDIDMLHDKKVNSLSGGELQKVMICKTLCNNANIYLLDEPSANLDIENRMKCIKAIKRFIHNTNKSIYIIEHDIMICVSLAMEYNSKTIIIKKENQQSIIYSPQNVNTGINMFLEEMQITLRTSVNNRPRINKYNSTLDRKQKLEENYYDF